MHWLDIRMAEKSTLGDVRNEKGTSSHLDKKGSRTPDSGSREISGLTEITNVKLKAKLVCTIQTHLELTNS